LGADFEMSKIHMGEKGPRNKKDWASRLQAHYTA